LPTVSNYFAQMQSTPGSGGLSKSLRKRRHN